VGTKLDCHSGHSGLLGYAAVPVDQSALHLIRNSHCDRSAAVSVESVGPAGRATVVRAALLLPIAAAVGLWLAVLVGRSTDYSDEPAVVLAEVGIVALLLRSGARRCLKLGAGDGIGRRRTRRVMQHR